MSPVLGFKQNFSQCFPQRILLGNALQALGVIAVSLGLASCSGDTSVRQLSSQRADTTAPTIEIDSSGLGVSPSNNLDSRTIVFSGTDVTHYKARAVAASSCAVVSFAGVSEVRIDVPFTFEPEDNGFSIVCAIGRDAAGNYQAIATASSVLVIDTVAPVVTLTSPINAFVINAMNQMSLDVVGTCSAQDSDVLITVGTQNISVDCHAEGTFQANANLSVQGQGALQLKARQEDLAGNFTEAVLTGTKDTLAPTILIGSQNLLPSPSNNTAPRVVSFSGQDVSHYKAVVLSAGNCAAANFVNAQEIPISMSTLSFLPTANSSNIVCAIGRDVAGNYQSAVSSSSVLVVDTVAPQVAWTTPAANFVVTASNQTAVNLSGTCSAGDLPLTITVGNQSVQAACNAQGVFSMMFDFSNQLQGEIQLKVRQADLAGNFTEALRLVIKDTQPPTITIDSSGLGASPSANLSARTVTVTGSSDLATYQAVVLASNSCSGANFTGALMRLATDVFTFVPAIDSNNIVCARGFDAAGNASNSVASSVLYIDRTGPTVALGSLNPSGSPSNSLVSRTLNVSGPSDLVAYKIQLVQTDNCSSASFASVAELPVSVTTFSFTPTGDGPYRVCAIGRDNLMNWQAVATASSLLVIDQVSPVVGLMSPSSAFVVNAQAQASLAVSGVCTTGDLPVQVTASGSDSQVSKSIPCANGQFQDSLNVTTIPDGAISILASQSDAAGNAAQNLVSGSKDTQAPTVSINSAGLGASPSNNSGARTLVFSGTDVTHIKVVALAASHCSSANFLLVTERLVSEPFTFTPAANSSNVVCAIGRDAAGNYQSSASSSSVLVVDTIAPVLSFTQPASTFMINSQNQSAVAVSGGCTAGDSVVSISANSASQPSVACSAQGTFSTSLNLSSYPQGSVVIGLLQTDLAGNQTQIERSIIKDTIPPGLSLAAPAEETVVLDCSNYLNVPFSGTCSENDRAVTLSAPGLSFQATCTNNAWSQAVNFSGASFGNGVLTISHTDAAGNTSTTTRNFNRLQSANNAIQLTTAQQLINIQNNRGACYHVLADIDLANTPWTYASQLGNSSTPFTGMINGNGYRIKNLRSPDAFIREIRGATIKNLIFESPRFGENSQSSNNRGLVGTAKKSSDGALIPRFENVHIERGECHSGSNPTLFAFSCGGFVTFAESVTILNSSVSMNFISSHSYLYSVGGFVGRQEGSSSVKSEVLIESSRAQVEVTYAPTSFSENVSAGYVGGLMGIGQFSSGENQFRAFRSHAELKLTRGVKLPSSVNARIFGWGGLVGAYFSPSASAQFASFFEIDQSSAKIDFDLSSWNLASAYLAGLVGRFDVDVGPNRIYRIKDSYAEGRLASPSSGSIKAAGAVFSISINNQATILEMERTYSNVEIQAPANAAGVKPYFGKNWSTGDDPQVTLGYYNSDLVPSGMVDSFATPKTTAQMNTASTWSGYSSSVWTITNGSLPRLLNSPVSFPNPSADLSAPSLTLSSASQELLVWNDSNYSSFSLSGSCSEVGRPVEISGLVSAQTNCQSNQTWSVNLNLSYVPSADGAFHVWHSDASGNRTYRARLFKVDPSATQFNWIPVSNASELLAIQNNKGGAYRLTQDIDLASVNWSGSTLSPFSGRLDGANYRIKNLKSEQTFIQETRGAQMTNLLFESPRLAEAAGSGKGLIGVARFSDSLSPTRLRNVHVIDGIYTSRSGGVGGLIREAYHVEMIDSTAQVVAKALTSTLFDGSGGLIGRVTSNSSDFLLNLLIQDSRSDFEVQYLPSTSATSGYIRDVGGLIGEGPDVFTDMFVEIKRSRAKVKLHATPGFTDFDAMYWGGLIGYFHSSTDGSVKVTESTAEVDFDLRLPMGWPAGIYDSVKEIGGLLPSIGGVDPIVPEVQDSYATGKILISSPTAQNISKIAGLSPVVNPWSEPKMTITRAYSNVQLDLQLGTSDLSGVARPFVIGSPIIVNQSFYNSELMTPGIPQDSYASPRTTTQMQTAATWLNAGYSPDVWEIVDGAMPTLKNITVQFPD